MQGVQKTLVAAMVLGGYCTGVARAEVSLPIAAAEQSLSTAPAQLSPDYSHAIRFDSQNDPASEPIAVPTPSALNLGVGGLALLAASRIARRIRLAA